MESTAKPKRRQLENIQALRAIAAMLVVAVHAQSVIRASVGHFEWFRFGEAGVDLFFVISGFIMVYTTRVGTRPLDFAKNRLKRVVPLYWIITLFTFGLAVFLPSAFKSTEADVIHLLKSLLFIPFVKGNGLVQPTVFVGWTLNYEMAFYALFALSLYFRKSGLYLVLAALGIVAALHPLSRGVLAAFYTNPIILEFGAGMIIGAVHSRLRGGLWAWPVLVVGLLALPLLQFSGLPRVVAYGIPATGIVVATLALEKSGQVIRGARLLGDASYSIYLTHFFVTQAFAKAVSVFALPLWLALTLAVLSMIASAIVGIAVHKGVERPLHRLLSAKNRRQRAAA